MTDPSPPHDPSPASDPARPTEAPPAQRTVTSINRGWLVKFAVIMLVALLFGAWGLYDALVAYPERGRADAQYQLAEYLDRLAQAPSPPKVIQIADPPARLKELDARRADLERAAAESAALPPTAPEASRRQFLPRLTEKEELDWLEALQRVGELTPQHARVENWREQMRTLTQWKNSTSPPKPLAAWDLPLQWIFVVLGFGLGLYLLWRIVRTAATRYTFDHATRTLTLPGGRTVRAADLAEVDKRKWDRFYVTLTTRDGRQPLTLDLLRFAGLEEWVLEMESAAFPDRAAARPAPEPGEGPAPAEPTGTMPPS